MVGQEALRERPSYAKLLIVNVCLPSDNPIFSKKRWFGSKGFDKSHSTLAFSNWLRN